MSDTWASALPQAQFDGLIRIREAGLCGMITLRGDPAALAGPLRAQTGLDMPAQRRIVSAGALQLAWMSPDELLLCLPHAEAPTMVAALQTALAGQFATVANVSDARAVFDLSGPRVRDVLAKLCPVDFATLQPGDIRRSRAAQVAAAILSLEDDQFRIICFRSVAGYMFDLLAGAAAPGSDPALYP
ncbi:MAG: sarcosine oxidase subunit gamma [Rhodobacteraceae bacterium]|nr:sarcosine oxidase subunit gamma [Paracoccaceae bacterium]TVR47418.1 MAG: sarcosine oxidase subunit gamma [Paracoccaceae bacterium]